VQDECGGSGSATFTITVVPATSKPVADTYYTGPAFYWTASTNNSTATLTLSATLKNGVCGGDIRTATVSFYVRASEVCGSTLTPIKNAQNLPVGLVNAGDTSTGTAAATVQYSIGSAQATTLYIAVIVGGNYTNACDVTTDGVITIAVPVPGGQICGGGTMNNSTGYGSAGYLKGSATDPAKFSFYVQYNKSLSNPQGGVDLTVYSYNKVDGTTDSQLHTYRFKSTSISTLQVNTTATPAKATFSSKANVVEIVNGQEVSVEGNDTMQLTLTDVDPLGGNGDTLAISVQRTKGGTWYSSNWNGTTTVEKAIVTGGLLSVK
jgi:hypothetical protein